MTDHDAIPLVEGDTAPPDIDPRAVFPDDDPPDVYVDPDQGDMPDDLPAGSYDADKSDHAGADDLPGGRAHG